MQEQLVTFLLADQIYGLEINSVREIIRLQPVTSLPAAPQFVAGLISLRNKVIPVIDLRRRFGLAAGEKNSNSRIIIMEIDQALVGVKVDAVLEVLRLEQDRIEDAPSIDEGANRAFLRGLGRWQDKLILLLDGNRLLQEKEDMLETSYNQRC